MSVCRFRVRLRPGVRVRRPADGSAWSRRFAQSRQGLTPQVRLTFRVRPAVPARPWPGFSERPRCSEPVKKLIQSSESRIPIQIKSRPDYQEAPKQPPAGQGARPGRPRTLQESCRASEWARMRPKVGRCHGSRRSADTSEATDGRIFSLCTACN